MQTLSSSTALPQVSQVQAQLHELIEQLRQDVSKVSDPKAVALFEISTEVLTSLEQAFEQVTLGSGQTWRK